MKKITPIICIGILLISGAGAVDVSSIEILMEDFDQLVDINVTVDILAIRSLDWLDSSSDPDFSVKVFINDEKFTSDIWQDTKYIYEPHFSAVLNVPDDEEFVTVKIQLWDSNDDEDVLCDIGDENDDVELSYSIKTGHWMEDDQFEDPSGYGRLCGYDDGNIYENEKDCEIWFNIYQNDADGDGLPYWMELNVYGTDPEVDNTGEDADDDKVPIEWEHRWGYDPLTWENHQHFDDDNDSISNIEEYLTSAFYSDPFRRDLFLEVDYMEDGPAGDSSVFSEGAKELIKNPFHRRNIVFHLDTGESNGGEIIPFDSLTDQNDVLEIYQNYFIQNEEDAWRRSVFHYGIYAYQCKPNGYAFQGDGSQFWGYGPGTNSYVISSNQMGKNARWSSKTLDYFYASASMHEMGHNLGFRHGDPPGVDVQLSKYPWQPGWWIFYNYKSIMNYHYTYKILDYSDGSHGNRDHDDWANIDFTHFEAQ